MNELSIVLMDIRLGTLSFFCWSIIMIDRKSVLEKSVKMDLVFFIIFSSFANIIFLPRKCILT